MGLLDQFSGLLKQFNDYKDANTPRNTRPAVSTANVIDQGLFGGAVSRIPDEANRLLQRAQQAPSELSALASPQMNQQVNQAMSMPQKANPNQWLDAGMELSGMAPIGGLLGHTVYHGSPHNFDNFDMSKIGTGEGAQAYGNGLYFSENPSVAGQYAENVKDMGKINGINTELSQLADVMGKDKIPGSYRKYRTDAGMQASQRYDELMNAKDSVINSPGNLYKVDIPDESIPHMLDWDRAAKDQPESVQSILKEWNGGKLPSSLNSGDAILRYLQNNLRGIGKGHQKAEDLLKEAGIPGIKYLDGSSRTAGNGTSNYVLFDDQMPRILEKNGKPTGLLSWADEAKKAKNK
jgi:hypothetical protein